MFGVFLSSSFQLTNALKDLDHHQFSFFSFACGQIDTDASIIEAPKICEIQAMNPIPESELGKKSIYDASYNPDRLFPIARKAKREEIGIDPDVLPFYGFDCWNHYEVSWLNNKGKPMVGIAEISYDCHSPNLIESKSLKLYFNSFNNTKISDIKMLAAIIKQDLEQRIEAEVSINLMPLEQAHNNIIRTFTGESLDNLDIECSIYTVEPEFLTVETSETVNEILYSDLLKSNCLITNQPDWGSVQITYTGKKIKREGLLKYLISFRNHNEFHEQCIERIFVDIMNYCAPAALTVYGRYTRRGGLDINPYRSTDPQYTLNNLRLLRQ